jgi:rubrerythrin
MEEITREQPAEGRTGAMEELARDPSSRKRFLKAVGGAGAISAFGIFLAACGGDDDEGGSSASTTPTEKTTGTAKQDLEILNYALTLEYLEAAFYADVVKSGVVTDAKIASLAQKIGQNEQEHVDALIATVKKLGGTPAAKPKTSFQSVIDGGPMMILETAATVENLGAAAYLGQAGRLMNPEVLAAALAIHSVEARHAAALNTLVGKTVVPDGAFAKPASMDEVLPQVKPFIVS